MYTKRTKDEIHCTYSGVKCTQTYKIYSCRRFWYTLWPTQNDGQSTLSSHDCARSCARSENEATLNKIRVCQFFTYRGRVSLFFRLLEKHFNFTCCFFFANMSKLQFLFVQHKKDMAFGLLSHGCLTYNSLDYCTIVMGLSFWWFTFDILSFSFSHFSLKFHVNVMSWCSKKYSSLTQLLWNTPLARYTSSSALFLPPTFPLFLSMTDSNTARYCRSRTPTHDNQRLALMGQHDCCSTFSPALSSSVPAPLIHFYLYQQLCQQPPVSATISSSCFVSFISSSLNMFLGSWFSAGSNMPTSFKTLVP